MLSCPSLVGPSCQFNLGNKSVTFYKGMVMRGVSLTRGYGFRQCGAHYKPGNYGSGVAFLSWVHHYFIENDHVDTSRCSIVFPPLQYFKTGEDTETAVLFNFGRRLTIFIVFLELNQ